MPGSTCSSWFQKSTHLQFVRDAERRLGLFTFTLSLFQIYLHNLILLNLFLFAGLAGGAVAGYAASRMMGGPFGWGGGWGEYRHQ